VQYYIWHGDTTGMLLLRALREAAARGVRVRLLIDDNGARGIDAELVALDSEPNIEVRLFNPFVNRRFKKAGYLYDFRRLNRRMHNKSFTADGQATVAGGRNVGDEYFGATTGALKVDLDVMLVGPVVDAVSTSFDAFWASDSAYPVSRIAGSVSKLRRANKLATIMRATESQAAGTYLEAIENSNLLQALTQGSSELLWQEVRMVVDDPAKGLAYQEGEQLLSNQLDNIFVPPTKSLMLVSPYFVPGKEGTDTFIALAEQGIDVRILTNSLDATDVTPVHAGYAKRRRALLEAGVRLFEMKRTSEERTRHASAGPFGSSASSLHAKTFAADGARAFVGSFNLDPRSVHLNTELGFVIESPELAQMIESAFAHDVPRHAYEVILDDGELRWLEMIDGQVVRLDNEPNSTWFRQAKVTFFSWLPVEWLL